MNKQIQNSTKLSIRVLIMCVIATIALFFFSCKKKKLTPSPVATETYYTVTFDSKGGSEVKAVKVKKGGTITLPANPTKADFVFGGWFTDDNTFKNQFDAKTVITADITLYAKWDLPDYTVTFDSKGGSEVKAVKVKKGGTITLPPDPTKTDFVFAGWFTDDNTFKNQFDAKTVITANLTLYAKWDVPEYTVTFDSKGGSEVKAVKVKKGGTITLPANPTKADFVFAGWFTDDNTFKNQFDATTPITANLTLYAKWDVPEYTVTFDSKGGSEVKAVKVKKGNTITLPANPTKVDFIFGGWFTDDDTFKNQFDAKTPITANLTLYAKWDVPEYTVTFNSKGGSTVNAITNVKKGSTIALPPNPTKDGFIFGGWFTDDNTFKNQFDAKTPVTADITLYAKWDLPEYTVTFNSKGGSAVNAITNVKKGSTITLPPNPTKDGFTFDGWYTDDNTFKNQFDATTPVTADITLYAKWTAVAPVYFSLSSESFTDGGVIPPKHAYPKDKLDHECLNVSPQLSWANAPAATTSFLIIMEDLDLPGYPHWTAYNIPADKTSVTEGEYSSKQPHQRGYISGNKYEGPWSPPGITHTYQITVFALDLPTTYFEEYYNSYHYNSYATKAEAEWGLGANILASDSIKGTFTGK